MRRNSDETTRGVQESAHFVRSWIASADISSNSPVSFPDFSASDAQIQWQRFCDLLWYHDDLGLWLDVSRMHLNASELEALQPAMERAFTAMHELEAGAIANPDEERQVGHYWLRPMTYEATSPVKSITSRLLAMLLFRVRSRPLAEFRLRMCCGLGSEAVALALL